MTNIERVSENTDALVKSGEAMMSTIDERVASLLPAVVDQDGAVDWTAVRMLPVTTEVGSLVVARAIPELILDESRLTGRLEADGRIEEALDHRNYVQALQSGSAKVLSKVNTVLFDTQEYRETVQTVRVTNEDGTTEQKRTQKASDIMDFSDALLMQMQSVRFTTFLNPETDRYELDADQLTKFVERTALPAAKLVRDGTTPETAFSVIEIERATGVEASNILIAADYLCVDIDDERERGKLAVALSRIVTMVDLEQFVNPTTGEFTLLSSDEAIRVDAIDEEANAEMAEEAEAEEVAAQSAVAAIKELNEALPGDFDDVELDGDDAEQILEFVNLEDLK